MPFADQKEPRAVIDLLQRSLQRGRLAHAYLFAGPRGSGKEAVARLLAQALNCERREQDGCGACPACRRIAEDAHPDVYWVRPESKSRRITVEQIREFETSINLKASLGRIKVGVVVDADCLGEEAGNAFLKTLEEPPAATVILLLTSESQRLLPTILSRCLRLPFGGAAAAIAPQDGRPARAVELLARFSTRGAARIVAAYGLHGQLLAILAEARAEVRARLEAEADLDRFTELEPKQRERLEEQLEARIEGAYRGERDRVLEGCYAWFADLLLCVAGVGDDLLAYPQRAAALRQAAGGLDYRAAVANLEAVELIRDALTRNVAEPLAFEVGLLQVTQ
jgi:DNA polymerase III subunit delta'